MVGSRAFLVPGVVALLLLAGCQSTPDTDLEAQLGQIAGVDVVDVDSTRVTATLADDISAADAQAAILEVRDESIAAHTLGADVELVVVLGAGPRDFGGAQPWEVYSYGKWSSGAVAGDAFAQQAAFVASLADWETLMTTPAQVLHVKFAASGVAAAAEPADGAATDGTDDTTGDATGDAPAEGAAVEQTLEIVLGQPYPTENLEADIAGLIAELGDLWVASGGTLDAVTIR